MNQSIPAIHKPSATLLIDDDALYIDNVSMLLPKSANAYVINPADLIPVCNSSLFGYIENADDNSGQLKSLELSEIISPSKMDYLPISVIVIDHCMEPHNGLDVLRRISSPFIQKILISNFFTNQQAIDALNEKKINSFICKMNPQFVEKLSNAIEEAQRRYFWHISLTMQNFLTGENLLSEPETAEIFRKIKLEHQVQYHQSSADFRYFEFFDGNGVNKAVMSIFPEDEIDDLINSFHAESAAPEILSLVKSGAMLPFSGESSFPQGRDWHQHLKSANSFQGKKKYFYAVHKRETDDQTRVIL